MMSQNYVLALLAFVTFLGGSSTGVYQITYASLLL